jgi:hypothetical protein
MLNYNTLRPISSELGQLPRLLPPQKDINGEIQGKTFQYQPSDHPKYWLNGGNLQDYTEDELLYTVNNYGFRGNDVTQLDTKPKLMTAGCSHTYGIGIRDHEVWGSKLAEQLDMYHINIGVGGIGYDTVTLLVKQFFEQGIIPDTLVVLWPTVNRKLFVLNTTKSTNQSIDDFIVNPSTQITPNVYQYHINNHPPEEEDIKMAIKGYLLQSVQQTLFDFWIYRELVISLCEHHNVKLIEGFLEDNTFNYVKEKCNRMIPRIFYNTWPDYARDGMHFGPRSNLELAKHFDICYQNQNDKI